MKLDNNPPIALVDFGASRIKAALWLPGRDRLLCKTEVPSPVLIRGPKGEAEGNPEDYWVSLSSLLSKFYSIRSDLVDVWFCSEMHGFLLSKNESPDPLTRYISWQDQRGTYRTPGCMSSLEVLTDTVGPTLMRESGLRLRAGLPVVNLFSVSEMLQGCQPVRFLTLIEWLLFRGGEKDPHCNVTMAAGTGLYSHLNGDWSSDILTHLGIDPSALILPTLSKDPSKPIGKLNINGRSFRAWGGIGDLQSAAHGLGFPKASKVFVNLGTGSQVMVESNLDSPVPDCEIRVSVEGIVVNTITHIPSGRALNTFASFIDGCSVTGRGNAIFWEKFSNLSFREVIEAPLTVNLNVFAASWRYGGGGSITGILESGFNCEHFLRSLARSWLEQYREAVVELTNSSYQRTFVLGGGLSRIGSFVVPTLEHLLQSTCLRQDSPTGEDSLDGLLRLARITTR